MNFTQKQTEDAELKVEFYSEMLTEAQAELGRLALLACGQREFDFGD